MYSAIFLVCYLTFDLTFADDLCWCSDGDKIILSRPNQASFAVGELKSGSCLNSSEFVQHGQWIVIKSAEKPGFVHHARDIQMKNCTDCNECDSQFHEGHTDNSATWTAYSECSVTCGEGIQMRQCTNNCPHDDTDYRVCKDQDCAAEWSSYGACSVTCGEGIQARHCIANCPFGNNQQTQVCHRQACTAEWSSYGACSVTCGEGIQTRHCIANCPFGNNQQTQVCHRQACTGVHFCDKFGTIQALAEMNITSKVHCSDRWSSDTSNFLHTHCENIPTDTGAWHIGKSVMDACHGSHSIRQFTPIATFQNHTYSQTSHAHDGVSGIFLECTSHGFKMATKACEGAAEVMHIPYDRSDILSSDAIISNNPIMYHIIEW